MGKKSRRDARKHRHRRVRAKISGTTERPRLNIYRSLDNIYAQVIDDSKGHTLVSASTIDKEVAEKTKDMSKVDAAKQVGQIVAERAKQVGITTIVFDRGGYRYHGRIKALAEGAREGGLDF
jgi:large subunit ribosomal protein L18